MLFLKLILNINRDKKKFFQEFQKGIPVGVLEEVGTTNRTGTTVEFWPDDTIFEVTEFNYETLSKRFKELAYLNPKITIQFKDNRVGKDETYHFEGGTRQFVEDLNKADAVSKPFQLVDKADDIEVDIAMLYNTSYHETLYSFVNNIKTPDGGTHEAGFRAGYLVLSQSMLLKMLDTKRKM